MPSSISVAICCYNSGARLPQTLAHLARQQATAGITWEVLVVDNASTDDTAAIAAAFWPKDAPAPLRVLCEPKPGVAHARRCALEQARYEIVSFVDDDNWICANWIQGVSEIMTTRPELGACGCRSEAAFETEPPAWLGDLVRTLAVGKQFPETGDVTDTHGWFWGAGMSLRKAAWRELIDNGYQNLLTSRTGKGLGAGEDAEFCLALRMAGWRLYNSNDLWLAHFIPAQKLRWDYFRRLLRGFGASEVVLDIYECHLTDPLGLKQQAATKSRRLPKWLSACWRAGALWLKLSLKSGQAREGDEDVLRLERHLGYLRSLWKERPRHRALHQQIALLADRLGELAIRHKPSAGPASTQGQ